MSELLELAKDAGPYGACFAMYLFYLYKTRGQRMVNKGGPKPATLQDMESFGHSIIKLSVINQQMQDLNMELQEHKLNNKESERRLEKSVEKVENRLDKIEEKFDKKMDIVLGLLNKLVNK